MLNVPSSGAAQIAVTLNTVEINFINAPINNRLVKYGHQVKKSNSKKLVLKCSQWLPRPTTLFATRVILAMIVLTQAELVLSALL